MLERVRKRHLELLCSIYVYNEHRGYTALDTVLAGVRERYPGDHAFIAQIEKHRADEYKHYLMFKRWFEQRGVMPFVVDRSLGQIDGIIQLCFGMQIDALDTQSVITSDEAFGKLCRIISLTERRGMSLVENLLGSSLITDRDFIKILKVVERDEPSHWAPYEDWLSRHGDLRPRFFERLADVAVHATLVGVKVPLMFVNPNLPRRTDWPDARDARTEALAATPQLG